MANKTKSKFSEQEERWLNMTVEVKGVPSAGGIQAVMESIERNLLPMDGSEQLSSETHVSEVGDVDLSPKGDAARKPSRLKAVHARDAVSVP